MYCLNSALLIFFYLGFHLLIILSSFISLLEVLKKFAPRYLNLRIINQRCWVEINIAVYLFIWWEINRSMQTFGVLIGPQLVPIHSWFLFTYKVGLVFHLKRQSRNHFDACRCQDGVLWGGATLHHRTDRPPAAPAPLRHDQTSDHPRSGVPGEARPRPPPAALWLSTRPIQQRPHRGRSSAVLVFILLRLLALPSLCHHADLRPGRRRSIPQQQLRGLAPTPLPSQRGGSAVIQLRHDGRGGVGPGGEGGWVHEVSMEEGGRWSLVLSDSWVRTSWKARPKEW